MTERDPRRLLDPRSDLHPNYSHEPNEPPHVHVDRDALSAKVWVQPVAVARNLGFRPRELAEVARIVQHYQVVLLEAWNEHFGA